MSKPTAADNACADPITQDHGAGELKAASPVVPHEPGDCPDLDEAERLRALQHLDAIGAKVEPGQPPASPAHSIGSIAEALRTREAASFAGLWIERQPRHRVVVAFTRDAARTLARYTRNPLFEPRDRKGPTLAELDGTMSRLMRQFEKRGYRFASAGRLEQHGKVVFELAQEAAPIRAAAARSEFELPPWVELKEPRPFAFSVPPASPGDQRVAAFPRLKYRTDMYPSTAVGVPPTPAILDLRGGCLILSTGKDKAVALWGAEDALDLSDPNRVAVLNRLTGLRIRVGDHVSLTGLQPGMLEARRNAEKIGEAASCPGPYRVVNGYELQAGHDARARENRILTLMSAGRLSRPAAEARYRAERKRLPELQALRSRLLTQLPDKVGDVWINAAEASAHLFVLPHTSAADLLLPTHLRPFVTTQQVPRSYQTLDAAKRQMENDLARAGIVARLETEVIGGNLLVSEIGDIRRLSAAALAGQVRMPDFARLQFGNAGPLGGYRGIGWDDLLQRYEKTPSFSRVRALVAATELPSVPEPSNTETSLRKPSRAESLDIAHWMIAYGFDDPERLARLQQLGADPISAWVRHNGLPAAADRAILAEQVLIAEPVAVTNRPGRDGYRTEVAWRIIETLKGNAQPGELVKQRLISGEGPDGSLVFASEEPMLLPGFPHSLASGSRWLLHLSRGVYRHQSLLVGGEGAAEGDVHASSQPPARLIEGHVDLQPPGTAPVALDILKTEIAPVQRAFVEAEALR